jgi:hypothetical protein
MEMWGENFACPGLEVECPMMRSTRSPIARRCEAFLAILWPRRWEVVANPHVVIRTYIESAEPVSIEDLHRELSFHIYGSYLANRGGLARLVVYFQVANVLFAVESVLWIVAIASIA